MSIVARIKVERNVQVSQVNQETKVLVPPCFLTDWRFWWTEKLKFKIFGAEILLRFFHTARLNFSVKCFQMTFLIVFWLFWPTKLYYWWRFLFIFWLKNYLKGGNAAEQLHYWEIFVPNLSKTEKISKLRPLQPAPPSLQGKQNKVEYILQCFALFETEQKFCN